MGREVENYASWMGMTGLSVACHLLLMGAVVLLPRVPSHLPLAPSVIDVSLVSLPSPGAPKARGPEAPKAPVVQAPPPEVEPTRHPEPPPDPETPKPAPPKAEPVPIPERPTPVKEIVSSTKKPAATTEPTATKSSLKKKTLNASEVVRESVEKMSERIDSERPKSVTDAIERLRQTVSAAGPAGREGSGGNGEAVMGGRALEQLDLYKLELSYRIEKNWAFSEQLARGNGDLETVIMIRIGRDGEIEEAWFEKRSGNEYLDESAYRAVKKSNPLPPLPQGYLKPSYTIGLKFTPGGLNRGGAR